MRSNYVVRSASESRMTKSTEVKRPSMLGHPKYRAREERRRLLKLCQRKLRSIEDPEQILRRAVLINNTMKQLQAKEVCPGEEREGWGRQCEERTVEVKLETKGDSKEVKATKEGRELESRIPEVPDTINSSSTPLSAPSPFSLCYNIEDILSEIVLPPPLSPQLEDLTNFREEERRSHLACRERLAAPSTMATTLESSCPGSQCQPSSQPHLLSSPALQNSYDAVVPSTTSSSSCNSFPPFDDPGAQEGFRELYHHNHHHQQQHHHHYQTESESGRMNLQCGAEDSMLQQDLYSPTLSSLLCKM